MELLSITIEGFRSFVAPEVFSFEDRNPGLYFMTGKNLVDKELGANATGKSTIWDALCWCFYGKTPRGLKGPDIKSWQKSNRTAVSIYFKSNTNEYYELLRTAHPNSLSWVDENGKILNTVTQPEIEDIIKLNYSAFLNTILIGQFNDFFFDLTPAQKERIFSETLDLDYWLDKSKDASTTVSTYSTYIREAIKDCSTVQGAHTECCSISFGDDITMYGERVEQEKKELQVNLDEKQKQLITEQSSTVDLENNVNDLITEKEDASELKFEAIAERKEYTEVINKLSNVMASTDAEIRLFEIQLNNLEGIQGKCPTCKQLVKDKHLIDEGEKLLDVIETLERSAKINLGKIQKAEVKENQLVKEERGLTKQLDEIKEDLLQDKNELRNIKSFNDRLLRECDSIENELLHLAASLNPFILKETEQRKKEQKLRRELSIVRVKLHKLLEEEKSYKYWIQGFREIRLHLMETALIQFEAMVTEALYQLGLVDWGISLSTDKHNSKGAYLGKGFQVLIQSPIVKKKVAWEVWSGGETQRLSLAGTIGFSSLITDRLGISPNIEIWDEPSSGLSEEGIQDLLEFLEYRAKTEGKQIWLVDHKALEFGGFTSKVIVIKDDGGSYIEESNN